MNRRTFAKMIGASPAAFSAAQTSVEPVGSGQPYRSTSPYDVEAKAQLFVDRTLVRETRDVTFRLHQGVRHPKNPLVVADQPAEGWRLEIFGSVLYDEDERLFKMWYIGEPVGMFGPEPEGAAGDNPTLYAISKDGIRWEKPHVGTLKAADGSRHNALLYATHLASVYKDREERDPAKRYKMICYIQDPKERRGYQTMVSPDGIHWNAHSRAPICPGSDVITGYYDEDRKLWVAMAKIATRVRGHTRRVFYLITSHDFEEWSKPELAIYPDLEDDAGSLARIEEARPLLDVPDDAAQMRTEFYGVGFHAAESCTIAFPWVFTINNKARYGNQEGPFEVQLAASRDLRNWQRPFRVPCIPRGKPGDWECGIQQTSARTVRVGDEVRLYYCGANYTHGTPVLYRKDDPGRKGKFTSSIGLATWKLDRFVSANGLTQDAQLTTVPLVFSGDRLEINAATSAGGSVRVEMLDAAGRPFPHMAISRPFTGDHLQQTVTWPEGQSPSAWKGRPVILRFHLTGAELYSFAFRRA